MESMGHQHPSHPYPLRLKPGSGAPYTCDGCREHGVGASYRCGMSHCTYVLHKECAHIVVPHATHRFFKKSRFKFHEKPLGRKSPNCDACGKDVLGFVYHCPKTKKYLHPCCLKLTEGISVEGKDKKLKLRPKAPSKCLKCNLKRVNPSSKKGGWSYVYTSWWNGYCYHVSCFKDSIHESWRRGDFITHQIQETDHSSVNSMMSGNEYSQLPLKMLKMDLKRRRSRRFKTFCNKAYRLGKSVISCINPVPLTADNN